MADRHRPSPVWVSWLSSVSLGVMAFGLALVLVPPLANTGFSLLLYADAGHIAAFGAPAVRYISLVHAVLGAVMFGWGALLFLLARGMFARGERDAWRIIVISLAAWFVPDTAFSLWSGFWQNAVLNFAFIVLFVVPLAATYRVFHETRA